MHSSPRKYSRALGRPPRLLLAVQNVGRVSGGGPACKEKRISGCRPDVGACSTNAFVARGQASRFPSYAAGQVYVIGGHLTKASTLHAFLQDPTDVDVDKRCEDTLHPPKP